MRRLLQIPSADPPLLIDADLRPEGKTGPLVRTLKSYEAYYRRWSLVWESQALLRAEHVAGDEDLAHRFIELIDPLRYPAERPRRGRGARDPAAQGPDGVGADAARRRPDRCTPSSGAAGCPTSSGRCSCSSSGTGAGAGAAHHPHPAGAGRGTRGRACCRREDAAITGRGLGAGHPGAQRGDAGARAGRATPSRPTARELAAVGRYLGYGPGHVGDMLEDYRRTTRRARAVVEQLFYGG